MQNNVENIYKEYNKLLMSFIVRRVPNRYVAEDILQEVFMKVINNLGQLKNYDKLKSWLFQIARNSIIDYYRHEKQVIEPEQEFIDKTYTYDEDAYTKLQVSVLMMIQQLPLKYRQALYLADYKGLTQKEISKKLAISYACAKGRVLRARKLMKKIYLDCCHFEFELKGKVIDFHLR